MQFRLTQRRPLSKLNSFDQNFMKLCHIVQYLNAVFKFDNGPYRTMNSLFMKIHYLKQRPLSKMKSFDQHFYETWSLPTIMCSSGSRMAHIASFIHKLLPFVYENSLC